MAISASRPLADGRHWSAGYAGLMFLMWWVMMIAMMTPGASPMILLYASAYRFEQHQGKLPTGVAPTFAFALGYLLAWAGFSLVATGMQWSFERAGLLHQMTMWSINPLFTATLLIGAGLYQLTPLKRACLDSCRSPARYLAERSATGQCTHRLPWRPRQKHLSKRKVPAISARTEAEPSPPDAPV